MNEQHKVILSVTALKKSYPSGDKCLEVLRGIDLSVGSGESLSIQGESGSGKSTLLNLVSGLDLPDSGSITWEDGVPVDQARRSGRLGIVFQSFYLIPEINALDNVLMARRVLGGLRQEDKARASELLARVGLDGRASQLPEHMSGGERQRVALARALMNQPRLVLADEPTGNLDEKTGETVIDLLLGLCAEMQTSLLLVTHNPAHAARTSRSYFLHEGLLRDRKP
jgi:predicted ABC-type transport system involved in lysophospholipase L1 biosynthesis ATPase subunit